MRVQSFCRMGTTSRARDASAGSDDLMSVRDAFRPLVDGGFERAIKLTGEPRMLGESMNKFGLQQLALAARDAIPQLGPKLLDVVIVRNHRPLLLF